MPIHLYTIPSGITLPDVTGLPEGYPFLLEQSDDTIPGQLYVLQGTAFVQPVASAPSAVVTATRTPVVFRCHIPATPSATTDQVVLGDYAGAGAGAPFIVPAGLASSTTALGQLREVTATTFDLSSPNANVTVGINAAPVGSTTYTAFPVTPAVVLDSSHPSRVVAATYNATLSANRLPAGTAVQVQVTAAAGYINASAVDVLVTLFFGETEQSGAMLGLPPESREAMLNERESELVTGPE